MTRLKLPPAPPRPSDIVAERFAHYEALSQGDFASALGMSRLTVSELLNGHRSITALMALKLARLFSTDAEFWLNLQTQWDLYHARAEHQADVDALTPLRDFLPDDRVAKRTTRAELGRVGERSARG